MATQPGTEIHLGKWLRKHVDEKKYNKAALARLAGWKARNVAYYFSRPSMQVSALMMLCHGMKYNFLRELADLLPPEFPSKIPSAQQQRISELEKEIERLKNKMEGMKEMAGGK